MKNHYILTPGEFFTVRELQQHRKDLELAFPIKDRGWDLLAIRKDGKSARIQVKESRVHSSGSSFHQLKKGKLDAADFFVFVIYTPVVAGARNSFGEDFLVIPRNWLQEHCKKKAASKEKYSFYFISEKNHWFEFRDDRKKPVDVSKFHNAWQQILPT